MMMGWLQHLLFFISATGRKPSEHSGRLGQVEKEPEPRDMVTWGGAAFVLVF
jgi:hypothetical protein